MIFMNTKIDLKILLNFAIATLLCYLLIILTFFIIIKLLKINPQTYLSPLSFGNTGNIGLPLAYFAFGEIGLGYAVLVLSITSILSFSIGIWFVSGETSFLKTLKNEPLLAATFLGLIFLATKSQTPIFFTSTLELIGQLAIPLMLITLGVAVANLNSTHLYKALKLSILKLIICFLCSGFYIFLLVKLKFQDSSIVKESYFNPIKNFIDRYGKLAILILLLISLYRMADVVMGVMANIFYLEKGYEKKIKNIE